MTKRGLGRVCHVIPASPNQPHSSFNDRAHPQHHRRSTISDHHCHCCICAHFGGPLLTLSARFHATRIDLSATRRRKQERDSSTTPPTNRSTQPPPCFFQRISYSSRARLRTSGLPRINRRSLLKLRCCSTRSQRVVRSLSDLRWPLAVRLHCG